MAKKDYNLFCSDPFGDNDTATSICNDKLVPLLKQFGISKQRDIKKIVDIVREIAQEAYSSGAENERFDISESDY